MEFEKFDFNFKVFITPFLQRILVCFPITHNLWQFVLPHNIFVFALVGWYITSKQ